jgi:RHH-type transcriptional regulator, proline utilization regulon repressor / proline dehydrogenase / delta 1-pyrroline-5-carboxylate dehydrogenase
VLRQPFGGMGKSGFGPGMKAGGPNYVAQFMDFEDVTTVPASGKSETATLAALCDARAAHPQPDDSRIVAAALSYEHSRRQEFDAEHNHFRLVGQDNVRRYLPVGAVRVPVHGDDTACDDVVSTPPGRELPAVKRLEALTEFWAAAIEFVEESDAQLARAIEGGKVDRVR